MNSEARKLHVWLLIGSGVVAAAQIGKAIISLPMIRTDLALGLDLAGMTVHHPHCCRQAVAAISIYSFNCRRAAEVVRA